MSQSQATSVGPDGDAVDVRRILLLAHTGREGAIAVARQVISALRGHGLVVRVLAEEAKDLQVEAGEGIEVVEEDDAVVNCELVVVLGGDGTILRAAELTHGT